MKNSKMFSRFGVAMVFALLSLSLQQSFAAGTRAGTKLTSTASITYNDNNSGVMTPVSASISIYVAHKPASTVVVDANQEGYDGGYVVYAVTVTNNGNGQDVFQIVTNVTAGASYIDSIGLYKDVTLTQGFTIAANTHIMTYGGAAPDTITPDGNTVVYAKVYLKSDPDSSGTGYTFNGKTIDIGFIARSTANMSDTTYANADATAPRAVSATFLNAVSATVSRTTTVKQSKLTLSLTRGQAGYRPGATTGYNATITNSGYGRAENVVLTVAYDNDQTYSAGNNWTGTGPSTYSFGTVASLGGSVTTVSGDSLFLLLADLASVLEGSTRTPTLSVTYNDSANGKIGRTRILADNPQSFNVLFKSFLQQSDITVALVGDTATSGNPGDTAMFKYTIANNSNGADGFNVRYSTATQGTWDGTRYWYEVTGAGFNASDDSLFAAGGAGSDLNTTKLIAKGSSITVYVRMAVPSGITTDITYIEHLVNSRRDSINIPTDFDLFGSVDPLLPNITVVRSKLIHQAVAGDTVASGGLASIMPGDSVTFFVNIENDGDGIATAVIITDDVANNANMTNVSNSAYIWDLVTGTEALNSDHVTIPNSPTTAGTFYGTITKAAGGYVVTVPNLAAGGKRQVKYTLKVN